MRFASIDVPQELVTAHADGDVVFFVGAGASVPPPTKLPLFDELTNRIAHLLRATEPSSEDLKSPDVYLGHLDADKTVDVHEVLAKIIGKARRRNALHDAIATLAAAPGPVRVVTTNYDDFLHKALDAMKVPHIVHEAPALPLGNDFEGVVHLHGRLGQPPRRLVVTDADFGTAYITRGWAPAFLRELFSRFVVCFVGYSHDDRMMDYLARGLPSDARTRFIVTDRDEPLHWERRGIVPVCYPHGEHHVVGDLLARWGAWARDTPFGRAQRVRALAADAPPADPDDHDFLVASLESPTLAIEVCNIAIGNLWAAWLTEQRPFKALLGTDADPSIDQAVLRQVAHWVANAGTAPGTFETVYRSVTGAAHAVRQELISNLLWELADNSLEPGHRSSWLRWVLTVASRNARSLHSDFERLWMADVKWAAPDALLILDHIANNWSLRATYLGDLHETHLAVSGWELKEGVDRHLSELDSTTRKSLLTWLTSFFEMAHRRTTGERTLDPWSFRRASISPHEQDSHSRLDAHQVLTDLARDALAAAFVDDPSYASALRDVWLASPAPLLRRLAIHALTSVGDRSSSDQVAKVLRYGLLYQREVRREVYELIARSAAGLEPPRMKDLVNAIVQGPPDELSHEARLDAEPYRDRRIYDLLHWLRSHRPDMTMPDVIEDIRDRHPEWAPDEHADLARFTWSGSRSIEDEWPWSLEEFHQMLRRDARGALNQVISLSPKSNDFWWPAGNVLSRTVGTWPEDGFVVWAADSSTAIRRCVLAGWAEAPLTNEQLDKVGSRLLAADLSDLGPAVAGLLHPWTNDPELRDRWVRREDGRELARRAFASPATHESHVDASDLYTSAINSAVGTLTEYWIGVAVLEAREGRYPGGGLSHATSAALSELIHNSEVPTLAIAPVLSQLDFFQRADPEWTRANLLSRLTPTPETWRDVEPLWAVVLRGRFSDDLLDAGLREWLLDCARLLSGESTIAADLARVTALIAVRSSMADRARLDWTARLVRAADEPLRVSWATEVASVTQELADDARSSLWKRWMRAHLRDRVDGVPRKVTSAEATALLSWVAALPMKTEIDEAAELLLRAHVGLDAPARIPSRVYLDEANLHVAPDAWARLLAGLLEHTTLLDGHIGWSVQRLAESLAHHNADPSALSRIRHALYNLGQGGH